MKGAACCRRRIELVQDLEFPEACHRIKATSDGKFLFATGIHPPRLRCYELSELSMKFERHFDSEVVDFQVSVVGISISAGMKKREIQIFRSCLAILSCDCSLSCLAMPQCSCRSPSCTVTRLADPV